MRYTGRRNLDGRVIWEGLILADSTVNETGGWFDLAGCMGLIFTFEGLDGNDEVVLKYANTAKPPVTEGTTFRNTPFNEDGEYHPKKTARWVKADHVKSSGKKIRVHIYGW